MAAGIDRIVKWDLSFLVDALVEARRSKDPSTKVGALIVRPDLTTASRGYNGFPRGIADTEERLNDRPTKYDLVVHAETNALLTAKEPLKGYTLYSTFPPCIRCVTSIIQAGIARVVSIQPTPEQEERWGFSKSRELLAEAGLLQAEYPRQDVIQAAWESGIIFADEKKRASITAACACC